jgi:hypothetical protein
MRLVSLRSVKLPSIASARAFLYAASVMLLVRRLDDQHEFQNGLLAPPILMLFNLAKRPLNRLVFGHHR